MRCHLVVPLLAALALWAGAEPAQGAGGYPFGGVAGPEGITAPGAAARYVTIFDGDTTVLERIQRAGGQVSRYRTLHGRLAVPAVAMDGTPGGLSADGGTLVLVRPLTRFPARRSELAVVDTRTFHAERLRLRGTMTFDAVSPDGRWLYLAHYTSPRDPNRYAVRAYDVRARRFAPGVIVDRREPGEVMRGAPLTRAVSPDGRWAYTLYDGAQDAPFVHALDTVRRRAFCIDLDLLEGHPQLYSMRLALAGGRLNVTSRDEILASVDAASFRVSPAVARTARRRSADGDAQDATTTVVLLGLGAAAGAGLLVARTRRRRPATPTR